MILGTTHSSLTAKEAFKNIKELDVLGMVMPGIGSLPCKIQSPFRKDDNPSFCIYSKDSHIFYLDFGTKQHGDLLDLLSKLWGLSLSETIDRVHKLQLKGNNIDIRNTEGNKTKGIVIKKTQDIQVVVRAWNKKDIEYWESYGVSMKWLKYANIHPISYKVVKVKNLLTGIEYTTTFKCDELAYVFVEKKDNEVSYKIYQPFGSVKWCSTFNKSVISLWSLLPKTGEKVVICSSVKDALCLSNNCRLPAISLQGEGYSMSDTAIKELKRRFNKIYICYDTDQPGIQDSKKLAETTGFINIIPDLGNCKDLSDYYKSLEVKEDFKKHIKPLFN